MSGTDYPMMRCVQEELNPQSDCTWRFLSSLYGVAEDSSLMVFMLCWLVNLVFWSIIVCTSSGSSNLKWIFIPKYSGLDIHLGVHEPEEEGTMMFLNAFSWHCVTPTRLYSDCNFLNSCCCIPGI